MKASANCHRYRLVTDWVEIAEELTALYLLPIVTAITVLFFLAPTYLKYMGHNLIMQKTVVSAAVIQVILLFLLVPDFAATDAALAYAIFMCGMYLVFTLTAHRELVMLKSSN